MYARIGLETLRMFLRPLIAITFAAASLAAQDPAPVGATQPQAVKTNEFTVESGTKVALSVINAISTKHSEKGDRLYLETAFPVLVNGRIVIPVGSWVMGTVTEVKKPGRVKGRGELYVRFDTLTLPNGVTREFRSRLGGMDAGSSGELDRAEGTVKSEGNKGGDVRAVGETTAAGAQVGTIAGSASGHAAMGLGIGAAAGAAAGLVYVLATRGPDAMVAKGSTVEMVLDRPLSFKESDLDFTNPVPRPDATGRGSTDKGGA